ncbi:galactose-1-phosphate uridylyltransferase [Ligilactobacillus salitolerans]|uniref:Galactose-1-phosphate uridylyltransferase n=1 Tax=Ligilactobacillus salitolerans TaxID=1808352 RepID=A0A401IVW0_9LACO|nr:UDP-glucose--hexose-1-phosphate uridylyltransferase [Ligilactobacillus salitolerans]GBG95659.1 galactose-1-phosphate uridylyltransferase [Ligilactobacillus salitolerans]
MAQEKLVAKFVAAVVENSQFQALDQIYLTNYVLRIVGDQALDAVTEKSDMIDLKDELVKEAQNNGKCGTTHDEQDIISAQLMELIVPAPSVVNENFWQTYQNDSPQKAIADFYALSKKSDYIKTRSIAKNIYFTTQTDYGDLEITINLSKPEKDPKQIALAKKQKATGYPLCQLCLENEGYLGRIGHPARSNHRVIRFDLLGEKWGFQYSPYAYFGEHCIFLDSKHHGMQIEKTTFARLLSIIEQFPGYFVGSNADLPIVGGSILTHEHYQGGRHVFAMEQAPIETQLHFAGFDQVTAGIVKWPMSVIRLQSSDKAALIELADQILNKWRSYSDPTVGVRAKSDNEPHHTVTPIARQRDGQLELDLVLRDNQTSPEFPDGIFHPHPDVQHIKQENIGLIEVMGLAILPPRLKDELKEVEAYLVGQPNKITDYHLTWAQEIKQKYSDLTAENVTEILQVEVGKVFARVLEDAGVFKRDATGQAAFLKFTQAVNDN